MKKKQITVTTNCVACGVGKKTVRVGMVVCDWCGSATLLPGVKTYAELKPGEKFICAADKWGEEKVRTKTHSSNNNLRIGPGCAVLALKDLRKGYAERCQDWRESFGADDVYPGTLGIVEE